MHQKERKGEEVQPFAHYRRSHVTINNKLKAPPFLILKKKRPSKSNDYGNEDAQNSMQPKAR